MTAGGQDKRRLVIVGDSAYAEVAAEYFACDSSYEVVGFSVELEYRKRASLAGLPVVEFEALEQHYAPDTHDVFVAVTYGQLNRLRTRLADAAKGKGYRLASYVSSRAFVWRNVAFGEHCFVFEDNTLQPFARVGHNVVLWSGNYIGHHSTIGDNCFVSSHVVVSGFAEIGANSFVGVNAAISNNVRIGRDNWIGSGVTILKDTVDGELYGGTQPEAARVSAPRFFKVQTIS
jgi:sugar O-acyltransferase (sialic acid O-acetyltransferase NeuD family)